jgi:hypothetical protein
VILVASLRDAQQKHTKKGKRSQLQSLNELKFTVEVRLVVFLLICKAGRAFILLLL